MVLFLTFICKIIFFILHMYLFEFLNRLIRHPFKVRPQMYENDKSQKQKSESDHQKGLIPRASVFRSATLGPLQILNFISMNQI